jgi:hypothetical protein
MIAKFASDSLDEARGAARSESHIFRPSINASTSAPFEVARCGTFLAQLLKLSVHDE